LARPNHRKQRTVEEPFAKDLQKELTGLATTVANLHTEQEVLQSEFQTVKQISAELATKIVRNRIPAPLALGLRKQHINRCAF